MQHGELCTDRCSRIINRVLPAQGNNVSCIVTARNIWWFYIESSNTTTWQCMHSSIGKLVARSLFFRKIKNRDIIPAPGNWLRDLPEWLKDFTENLEDERVLASRDTSGKTSHDSDKERLPKEVSRKHSVFTHLPKDQNCEVCERTKITRAPCKKRIGDAVHRAEKFGDLITADHKVLSEDCESRNNHRYAVVVQDLPLGGCNHIHVKQRLLKKQKRVHEKILESSEKPKAIYTDNSLEFGKSCEESSWNHCTSTPDRSETNGIPVRAVCRIKEGTSAVLVQSDLDEKLWADAMECDLSTDGKLFMKGDSESCKSAVQVIIGTLRLIETCRKHGPVSRSSQ